MNDEPQSGPEEPAKPVEPDLEKELLDQRQKYEELLDKQKRLQADFENYRKRSAKEREETIQLATSRLVKELLLLVDNFERALAVSKNSSSNGSDAQGLRMMYVQLLDILRAEGVTEIETKGKLDPFQHEVMTKVVDPSRGEDEIVECVQKGYKMRGRVIRPARVIVNKLETEPTNHKEEAAPCETKEEMDD